MTSGGVLCRVRRREQRRERENYETKPPRSSKQRTDHDPVPKINLVMRISVAGRAAKIDLEALPADGPGKLEEFVSMQRGFAAGALGAEPHRRAVVHGRGFALR